MPIMGDPAGEPVRSEMGPGIVASGRSGRPAELDKPPAPGGKPGREV